MARKGKAPKTKMPIVRHWWFWLLVVVALASAFSGVRKGADQVSAKTNPQTDTIKTTAVPGAEYEYDALKQMFQKLTLGTTVAEAEKLIVESGLPYTKEDYNGSVQYRVAYTEGAALQKYADSGDSLDISFSRPESNFQYAEYTDHTVFAQALLYNYGAYFDLITKEPNAETSGYYYCIPGKGREKMQSAKEVLDRICQLGMEKAKAK